MSSPLHSPTRTSRKGKARYRMMRGWQKFIITSKLHAIKICIKSRDIVAAKSKSVKSKAANQHLDVNPLDLIQEVRSCNLAVNFGTGPVVLAFGRVFSATECIEKVLRGRPLEPSHMLVQVVSTNDMYNLMPILTLDDTNDIILLCDAVTNCIQWPKNEIRLEDEIGLMDLTNAVAEDVAAEMVKEQASSSIGSREPLVTQTELEELGIEFQMLHDIYLAVLMDGGAGFFFPVEPGLLQPEGFQMSVDFSDIKDLMTYEGLDVSILQVWTLYCRSIIPPTEDNNNDIAFLDANLICETYITHYKETAMEYLVDALLQYNGKKLVFAPYHQ